MGSALAAVGGLEWHSWKDRKRAKVGRLTKLKERLNALFSFSKSERRGVIWLLPLLAVVGVLIVFVNKPTFEKSFLEVADSQDSELTNGQMGDAYGRERGELTTRQKMEQNRAENYAFRESGEEFCADSIVLFQFDPNSATIQQLVQLGFSAKTAAGIIKYRERGKVFEIAEDFATCYGVTMEHYTLLEPYIVIGGEYKAVPFGRGGAGQGGDRGFGRGVAKEQKPTPEKPFDPNRLNAEGYMELGFSPRQAEVIVSYRENLQGFRTAEDLASCFVVSEADMKRLSPYISFESADTTVSELPRSPFVEPIELNRADSAELRRVSGIGEVLVMRILDYRERLGGYANKQQLTEVKGMMEANYERICKQIIVDSCEIRKISVNIASHKELVEGLGNHPYVSANVLRRLLKQRQLKGGWSKLGDLVNENIVTQREAERLAPYLLFIE